MHIAALAPHLLVGLQGRLHVRDLAGRHRSVHGCHMDGHGSRRGYHHLRLPATPLWPSGTPVMSAWLKCMAPSTNQTAAMYGHIRLEMLAVRHDMTAVLVESTQRQATTYMSYRRIAP